MIQSISQFRGQEVALRLAARAIERGKASGTLLICGTRGLGKTTLARSIGLALNCLEPGSLGPLDFCGECYGCRSILAGEQPEFMEIRPIGQDIKVEQFEGSKSRSAKDDTEGRHEYSVFHAALMSPAFIRNRVFLIDGAHYLNRATGNQLLKLLEEAPAQTVFILVSERPQLMLPTILSRSRRFDLLPLGEEELAGYVEADCPGATADAAGEAARMSAGRYVDACALAANADWRAAVRALSSKLGELHLESSLLDRLMGFELGLLMSGEYGGEADLGELLGQIAPARRNELRRQALIAAVDRAVWWRTGEFAFSRDFARDYAKLKSRINQNVDPSLATAAFSLGLRDY